MDGRGPSAAVFRVVRSGGARPFLRCLQRAKSHIGNRQRLLHSHHQLMEDAMTHTDTNSLYVLVCSLAATLVSLPTVWYFAATAPGLVA